jgi:hypothetical protein
LPLGTLGGAKRVTKAAKSSKSDTDMVCLELNPGSAVDVLGDPPVLWVGMFRDFTKAEAKGLLALRNEHGTPLCRIRSVGAE